MDVEAEPKLAPPGAGLPKPELFIARLLFTWRRTMGNREVFNAHFQQERAAIDAMISGAGVESCGRRVLIQRVRGLEDSSRYWSVWMTLDHLRIVHGSIARTIGALTKGVQLGGAASTAAVKPSTQADAGVLAAYNKSCDDLLTTVAATEDLRTRLRYAHPWFGPLDASGWHALAAGHLKIHRMQIERILEK